MANVLDDPGGTAAPLAFKAGSGSAADGGVLGAATAAATDFVPGADLLVPGKMERAFLHVFEAPSDKASRPTDEIGKLEFQFNPQTLKIGKRADYARETNREAAASGTAGFVGSAPADISLELLLDASEKRDNSVPERVEDFFRCLVATKKSRDAGNPSPPYVIFKWGGLAAFNAIVTSVDATFTLFLPTGTPIRAKCNITLQEAAEVARPQNPTSGTLLPHAMHTMVAGDTLSSVSTNMYGTPRHWRALADANGIDDPMRITLGTAILVPSVKELGLG